MGTAMRHGRMSGLAFAPDYSWLVVLMLGIWSLARQSLPATHAGWSLSIYWIVGAIVSALFFVSVAAHELARGFVARAYSIPERKTTLFAFGGTPDIDQQSRLPHQEVLIALAGPGMSLALAVLFYELSLQGSGSSGAIHALVWWLAWLHLMLFFVNLLPAYPLAGGRILRAVIWDGSGNQRRATTITLGIAQFIALVLLLYGSWQVFSQLRSGSWGDGQWIAVAGWLLHRAVTQSEQQAISYNRHLLLGYTARDAMLTGLPCVLHRLTLDLVIDQIIRPGGHHYVMVVKDQKLVGFLSIDRIASIPQKQWPVMRAEDLMLPMAPVKTVHPDLALATVLERMACEHELVVVDGERPIGLVTRKTVLGFLDARMDASTALMAAPSASASDRVAS